ncbi:hypothetical protein AVEN_48530-1 [Araneus ventricosus]|uniref:Uncharacterized protein n=1 Tax=Araneus ventricosus TaxID=182803 RepID=A0A4Y2MX14_ARAVE|nr:hypothetical protein AVEN_48530-1 [Araneus ventricosus]
MSVCLSVCELDDSKTIIDTAMKFGYLQPIAQRPLRLMFLLLLSRIDEESRSNSEWERIVIWDIWELNQDLSLTPFCFSGVASASSETDFSSFVIPESMRIQEANPNGR